MAVSSNILNRQSEQVTLLSNLNLSISKAQDIVVTVFCGDLWKPRTNCQKPKAHDYLSELRTYLYQSIQLLVDI